MAIISMKFYDMSHFARSNGKETVQRAHCALVECKMSKVTIVKLLSERTSGVPPVIF